MLSIKTQEAVLVQITINRENIFFFISSSSLMAPYQVAGIIADSEDGINKGNISQKTIAKRYSHFGFLKVKIPPISPSRYRSKRTEFSILHNRASQFAPFILLDLSRNTPFPESSTFILIKYIIKNNPGKTFAVWRPPERVNIPPIRRSNIALGW